MKDQYKDLVACSLDLKKRAENLKITWKVKNPYSSSDFNHIEYTIDNPEAVYNFVMEARELINLILENKDATNI